MREDGSAENSGGDVREESLWKRLGAAGPMAAVAAAMPAIGGIVILGTLGIVGPWLRDHGSAGIALYVVALAVCSGLALLPTYSQAILGGWAFGFATGFPAALTGIFGGAVIGMLVARRAASDDVMKVLASRPEWLAVRNAMVGSGFWKALGMVTLVRLPPNSPFALTNLALGSTRVPWGAALLGTVIGLSPRTAAAVWIAASVQSLAATEAKDAVKERMPEWIVIGGIGLSLVVVVVIGMIATRVMRKWVAEHPGATPAPGTEGGDRVES